MAKKIKTVYDVVPEKKAKSNSKKMTSQVFESICEEMETTYRGLYHLCKERKTSSTAFYNFMDRSKDSSVRDRYVRARQRQGDYLFDLQREVVFKRDEDHTPFTGANVVGRDRLISDTIKWQASKLKPNDYGDKSTVDSNVKVQEVRFDFDILPEK
jgi:hypothetical protein